MFMAYLNSAKISTVIASGAVLITLVGGSILAINYGFEDIVIAYLVSAIVAAGISTAYVIKITRGGSNRLFARYV